MQQAKYERQGKNIRDLVANKTTRYKFVNEAKRESRRLQMAAGGLGLGSLTLVK